ncbi:MAG TPA: alpha/beta fold hydrolase [Kofleriaceae bacterium]|jgi:dipeptidyl aminopeptidase/acylaminoacyl peptidase
MRRSISELAVALALSACAVPPRAEPPLLAEPTAPAAAPQPIVATPRTDLIPRAVLFGAPDRVDVRLAPDAKQLAWRAHGALMVAPIAASIVAIDQAKQVADHVAHYAWAGNELVFTDDAGTLSRPGKPLADHAELLATSKTAVAVSIDHAIYRIELSGAKTLVERNADGFTRFLFDAALRPAFAEKPTGDGGMQWFAPKSRGWAPFDTIGGTDALATTALEVSPDGRTVYAIDSRGRDTAALVSIDLRTKASTPLSTNVFADATSTIIDPTTRVPVAASFTYVLERWVALDYDYEADVDGITSLVGGDDYHVVSQSADNRAWIVQASSPQHPARYFAWDRTKHHGAALFSGTPALDKAPLVPMHTVNIPTRDGLPMIGYLSLPTSADPAGTGRASSPLPLVLLVHGGPWARDRWGYSPVQQLLANRGYAVLAVNFRGSTGFGKRFTDAGDREWGKRMQDDLLDAVGWAAVQAIARPDRIAIAGAGYGGYAALMGLELTPERFACGVDLDGFENLVALVATLPASLGKRVDEAASPLGEVVAIERPLFISHHGDDARLPADDVKQVVDNLASRKIAVTEIFDAAEPAVFAAAEPFLAKCLGGSYEAGP